MTEIFNTLLSVGGPLYLVVGLAIAGLIWSMRMLWKELKIERENSKQITLQMFDVINKNTEVISENTTTTEGLGRSVESLSQVMMIKSVIEKKD